MLMLNWHDDLLLDKKSHPEGWLFYALYFEELLLHEALRKRLLAVGYTNEVHTYR